MNLEEGSSTVDFESWMKGSLGMERLSLKKPREGCLRGGGFPSLGTMEHMLRKAPDTGISFHRGLFTTKGNLESGMGLIYREI